MSRFINLNTGTVEEVLPIIAKLHDEGLGYGIGPAIVCQEAEQIINGLHGALLLVRKIAEPLIQVDDVWEDATHIVSAVDHAIAKARGEHKSGGGQ